MQERRGNSETIRRGVGWKVVAGRRSMISDLRKRRFYVVKKEKQREVGGGEDRGSWRIEVRGCRESDRGGDIGLGSRGG